jgi:hypothetical protein
MNELKLTLSNLGDVFNQLTKIAQSKNVPFRLSVKEWRESRSITANAQYYKWLPSVASFYGEDVEFIRKWMKHSIAWPIVERGGCSYAKKVRYMLDKSGYHGLKQAQKIEMVDLFQMTSVMDSAQHTHLRDELQIYWSKQGLQLEYLNGKN